MHLPWVSRSTLRVARATLRKAQEELLVANARASVLQAQLTQSQADVKELNLKLLRVGFGLSPFQEALGMQPSSAPEPIPQAPQDFRITPGMTADQIQQTFALEGAQIYGNDMRAIMAHIEKRQAEYYGVGRTPSVLSDEEARAARSVQDDLLAAVAEGKANAGRGV